MHESLSLGVSAELVEPQPLDSPLPPAADDVPQHCHRWLGALMMIHRLEEVTQTLSELWEFQISLERLQSVAASVERAESLALCGGFALTLDVRPGSRTQCRKEWLLQNTLEESCVWSMRCRARATDLLSPLRPLPGSEVGRKLQHEKH